MHLLLTEGLIPSGVAFIFAILFYILGLLSGFLVAWRSIGFVSRVVARVAYARKD
jgi:hypothetical protein